MLYIIPTPIGNLEDITLRSLRILKESDLILAEDTRVSGKLLKHYNIKTPMESFHMYNEHIKLKKYLEYLKKDKIISVVSDAGTPGISDPGYLLVRNALENEIKVSCLPGPTALIPALVQSGIPCDRFIFEGFLPSKKGRLGRLKKMATESKTIVFYESPHKLLKLIYKMNLFLGVIEKLQLLEKYQKYMRVHLQAHLKKQNYILKKKHQKENL